MDPRPKRSSSLTDAIANRTASVCVVGQGYVGLSIAAAAAAAGMDVLGVDLDDERVQALARGRLVVPGVDESVFAQAYDSRRIRFTTCPAASDVTLICVPTPVLEHRPDLSAVEAAGRAVAPHLRPGDLVILESTTYPGTTEQVLLPLLESSGLRAGTDFLLAYSPERIDPGNPKFGLANTPRVVGGATREATEAAAAFYAQLVDEVMTVSSCRAAEMAKLLENTFRMVNIALVNELAVLCREQGIEPWEVIDAAATKPFGYMPFYPGPGVGGHCIPLDPAYLAWQSRRDAGRPYRLVELAQDINAEMPAYVVSRIAEALNDRGKAVNGARILALGVTYKENIGDTRESAAIHVIARLRRKGARVTFHDPFIERIEEHGLRIERVELNRQAFEDVDLVALLIPHAVYDLAWIVARSPLLFDARNAVRPHRGDHVVVL
ncbi:MAG: nucleotide sugar dehydrogenase [Egibacteraceae bacterium]